MEEGRENTFDQTDIVNAAVLEETSVFDCDDRVLYNLGDFFVLQQTPLGPIPGVEQSGDQFRLQRISRELLATVALDRADLSVLDADTGSRSAAIAIRSRFDLNARPGTRER